MSVVNEGKNRRLDTAADIAPLASALAAAPNATSIKLGGDSYSAAACAAVADALAGMSAIKTADLNDMFVSRLVDEIKEALDHLCKPLVALDTLESLDLSNNAFGPRAALNLVELLSRKNLRELKLNNNGLGSAGAEIISKALVGEGSPVPLRMLVMGRNRLETDGALSMAKALSQMTTLEHLQMPSNGTRPAGIKALLLAAKNNPNLTFLDLSDNNMKGEATEALLEVLPSLQKIQYLHLGDSMIGNTGVTKLAKILATGFPDLKVLDLNYNDMEDEAAFALLEALQSKKAQLEKLELNGNIFSKKALKAIRDFLADRDGVLGSLSDNEDDDEDDEDEDEDDEVNELAEKVGKM